jgi:hypothetical protein
MTEAEALRWRGEQHPRHSATQSLLLILDTAPDRARFQAVHERAVRLLPRLRARVQESVVPVGPPRWVTDPHFDLDYHVRRVRLPAPGRMPQLFAFAQQTAMTPVDRSRPLWEATLVEGLPEGRAAYLLKVHRSLADAAGAPRLPELHHSAVRLFTAGVRALARPRTAAADALHLVASVRRAAAPLIAPGSPLFRGRTGSSWRYGVLECRLTDLQAAAEAAGGRLGDAYLAALLGGVRRYHEIHGTDLAALPVSTPVGERRTTATFAAPLATADPRERIAALRGISLMLNVEPALEVLPAVLPVLNRLPSAVAAATGRIAGTADLHAVHLPGPPHPHRLAGATVERVYPFGPPAGSAMTAVMVPHAGVCCVAVTIDGTAVADPDKLINCLHEGFEEVLATR